MTDIVVPPWPGERRTRHRSSTFMSPNYDNTQTCQNRDSTREKTSVNYANVTHRHAQGMALRLLPWRSAPSASATFKEQE
jgi:hypothetical protein